MGRTVESEHHYRMLAFLAGFGAAGALGCDWLMNEEKEMPELLREQTEEALASQADPASRAEAELPAEATVDEE